MPEVHACIGTLRLQQRTLREVASRCGFTQSLLSKIESGKSSPPLSTLARIAQALGVGLSDLLQSEREASTVATSARALEGRWKGAGGADDAAVSVRGAQGPSASGRFVARGRGVRVRARGQMLSRVGSVSHLLGPGDSLNFNAEEEHDLEPLTDTVKYLGVFCERPEPPREGGS